MQPAPGSDGPASTHNGLMVNSTSSQDDSTVVEQVTPAQGDIPAEGQLPGLVELGLIKVHRDCKIYYTL
jgi:hypothetical protein